MFFIQSERNLFANKLNQEELSYTVWEQHRHRSACETPLSDQHGTSCSLVE